MLIIAVPKISSVFEKSGAHFRKEKRKPPQNL